MKRDMDLIRLLLLSRESDEKPPTLDRYTEAQQLYHIRLIIEAGLVHGNVIKGSEGEVVAAVIGDLTWAGHDFLDAAHSETIWNKAKDMMLKAGGSWTMDILKTVLTTIIQKEALGG